MTTLVSSDVQSVAHKNLTPINVYKFNGKPEVLYTCSVCGQEGHMHKSNWITCPEIGCGVCNGKRVVSGVNDIYTTNPELVIYFKNKEDAKLVTRHSIKTMTFVCPNCGYEKTGSVSGVFRRNYSCKMCRSGVTFPEKLFRKEAANHYGIKQNTLYEAIKHKRKTMSSCGDYLLFEYERKMH